MGTVVYLLHYDRPYGASGQQHYIGRTANLDRRLRQHRDGESGSATTSRARAQGIGFVLARTWLDDGKAERRLKNVSGRWLCPFCVPMFTAHADPRVRGGRHSP
jgi:predicted GIY-YIG superfamily endonuclease